MEFQAVARESGAFQQSITAGEVEAVCRRAFGAVTVVSATELGGGSYNSTYKVVLDGIDPVVLRVAPAPSRQLRCERVFMRNEHASVPYLAPIAHLMPRTLAVDFTHQLIGRDWIVQSFVPGRVAGEGFRQLPPDVREDFWRQLGELTAALHSVRGPHFGMVGGPAYPTWSAALTGFFGDIAADLDDCGLDAADVRAVADLVAARREAFDGGIEARLCHGDLWFGNVLVAPDGRRVVGVLDSDRTFFGDPMAEWNIFRIRANPEPERAAFWATYGPADERPGATLRERVYAARYVAGLRLEYHRLGMADESAATYPEFAEIVASVGA